MNVSRLFHRTPVSAAIALACLAVYALTSMQAKSLTNPVWGSTLGTRMVLYGPLASGEEWGWLRTVAAGFLHVDPTHIFVNLFMLALIGTEVERFVGSGPYVLVYGAGVLGSSASVLAMNFDTPTAGASGAMYALMGVLVAVAYRRRTDLRAPLALVVLNVVFSLVTSGVSLWGHLGGLLVGAAAAWPVTSPRAATRSAGAVVALLAAAAWVVVELSTGYPQVVPTGIIPQALPTMWIDTIV
ncbi:rhomboid family intramembrane serine protease [Corynebacterium sp. LK2510]|uniref:rhomboid family intramembrane serine protease n=1 Tax=Corynebacterium sp. LK2510 TaxID=3110472 RepID=UPI0034CF3944